MDKDLVTRVVLVVLIVAAYLVASRAEFYTTIIAPLAVVLVAVVMFWPRRDAADGSEASETARQRRNTARQAQQELRGEPRR
ncbi:hypothetical protein JZY91_07490 [Corynebacterium sp. CNCTC7651]|uniref:hypothetical protein n=1 Tax=Corynebacterium sp. CNCTC7651 TaxID=2815361 RepID=UPI001F22F21E|nr:hypothetical protein [Corynebacterium sp. CNCTC7651]UIZ91590.1 hypothetical protein JZY91_07490 [Corynebacterium sp. CNCTC7651]